MTPQAFVLVVAFAGGVLGLWLAVRLDVAAATSRHALVLFALAWLLPGLAAPLVTLADAHLRVGLAILATVLPVLTATFLCTAACLRYLIDRLGHAAR